MGATIGIILGLGVFFFLPVLGIYHGWQLRERRSRKEFAIFLGQVWGIGLLIGLVQFFPAVSEDALRGAGTLYALALIYPFYKRLTYRANDAGMPQWTTYLAVLPFLNFLMIAVFLFKPSKPRPLVHDEENPENTPHINSQNIETERKRKLTSRWWALPWIMRTSLFAALLWIVLFFGFFVLFEPFGSSISTSEAKQYWALQLLLPFSVVSGVWIYLKFVANRS